MDLITALNMSDAARDAAQYKIVGSIEEGGEYPSMPVPFGVVSDHGASTYSSKTRAHATLVITLVAAVFAITGALAWYLW